MQDSNDTIAAIATPLGQGAIGVIRISGPRAAGLAGEFFFPASGGPLPAHPPRSLVAGEWRDRESGRLQDKLLCAYFPAPASFTGEDVVEVQAHGGAAHLRALLQGLLKAGARAARPGEFTQRALLNGKMDLTRAEAVADLIAAKTALSREVAARQLAGGLFEAVESLRQAVRDLAAQVEAAVDFPDEEEQLLPRAGLLEGLRRAGDGMRSLLATSRTGRLLRQGLRVVLCGLPNAGKSSLLNRLLGSERAIVTELPGTTRDFLEEDYQVEGFPMVLVDTAGWRQPGDSIEAEGVARSRAQVAGADVVLLVLDASRAWDAGQEGLVAAAAGLAKGRMLAALNKSDLPAGFEQPPACLYGWGLVRVSARSGEGLDALKAALLEAALGGDAAQGMGQVLLTQARHEEALRRALASLEEAAATLEEGRLGAEFLSGDLRACLDALGEIVGATPRQEILDAIFSRFCIGK